MATDVHLREKLTEARYILASNQGTITERLKRAYLRFAPIMVEDVGEAYRRDFENILQALLADGDIETTMNGMTNVKAQEVERNILELRAKLEQLRT